MYNYKFSFFKEWGPVGAIIVEGLDSHIADSGLSARPGSLLSFSLSLSVCLPQSKLKYDDNN